MAQNSNNRGGNNNERGFAAMDENTQRKIAQKGGEAVSRDRQHMSDIGRKGGESRAENQGGQNSERRQPRRWQLERQSRRTRQLKVVTTESPQARRFPAAGINSLAPRWPSGRTRTCSR